MMSIDELEKKAYQNGDPFFIQRIIVDTYEDFVDILNHDIDAGICEMELDPKSRKNHGEDALTQDILMFLRGRGYSASHDTFIGGHADIVVRHHSKGFIWIAEAKIHKNYHWLNQGYQQLTTRYLRGTDKCCHGGMIYYVHNKNCLNVVNQWKAELASTYTTEIHFEDCTVSPSFAFYTKQKHQSGMELKIRHRAVQLYFDPQA